MATTELICLACKTPLETQAESCPNCSEKVTQFQRTYSTRLLDGKYQIIDRLGIGGMGEIFKVRHIHLNEQRVIKIMRSNIATDEQALQRFLYEAKLATTVKQRNLAMLYDFSTLDDGSYYMVWEFIDGVNIQKWISRNGPMPARLAVEVAIQALLGLGALHEMGIIHRDISPENIMLSQDHGGRLLVKVIDFGIAKQLSENEGGQGLTATGMFLGKLKYASPEQAGFIKEGEQLDARSDLYSFGIVLYEMLAGRAPFLATNPHGYILKHATEKPLPFAQINPDVQVPAVLERLVLKSLEKDRDDRHTSSEDFVRELESIRSSIPPESRFGLGERMVTLSASQTLVDSRPSPTGSGTAGTRPAPTLVDKNAEPTVAERGASPTLVDRVSGSAPTLVEKLGADATPTLIENLSGAAPTAVEARWSADAAPTVIERKFGAAPGKKKPAVWIGAAAAAVLVASIGAFMFTREKDQVGPIDSATTIASITSTQATSTSTAAPDASSVLLLMGSPWAQLELSKLEHLDTNQAIDITGLDPHLPLRVPSLRAGTYRITMNDASGKPITKEIVVEQQKVATFQSEIDGNIDLDRVVEDILKQ